MYKDFIILVNVNDNCFISVFIYFFCCVIVNGIFRGVIYYEFGWNMSIMLNFKGLCKDIIFRLSCDKCFGMWVIIVFEISDYSVKV